VALAPSPAEAAARCDILSVHLALGKETRGLVGQSVLDRLKRGAIFINTARGEIVDHDALAAAVRDRGLRAGLDVFPDEPPAATAAYRHALADLPGVYGTHHIGASTDQAQEAIAAETVRIVKAFLETGRVLNVVNLSRQTPAKFVLVVRHKDEPGVLAHVFDSLRAGNVNVEETENIVFTGARAAVARINLDSEPSDDLLRRVKAGNPHVLDVHLVPLGAPAASYQLARSLSAW
jgi:D-3-phosphoglycerate dehydrogenase